MLVKFREFKDEGKVALLLEKVVVGVSKQVLKEVSNCIMYCCILANFLNSKSEIKNLKNSKNV